MNVEEFLKMQEEMPAQLTVGAVRDLCKMIGDLKSRMSALEEQVESLSDKVWDRDPMDE